MAGYFEPGEQKVRPGAYFNVNKNGDEDSFGAIDGIVAVLFKSNFGPLGTVTELSREDGYENVFGTAGTTDALREAFNGGAKTIIACRVGTGGTQAKVQLATEGEGTLDITAKYVGSMDLSVTIKKKLADESVKECIIYADTREYEKFDFAAGEDEAQTLLDQLVYSEYFTAKKTGETSGALTEVSQSAFTAGEDPTTQTADYSTALSEVEKYFFNAICVDTEDKAVHALVSAFLDRVYEAGQFGVAFLAEKHDNNLNGRITTAAGHNKENIAYVLNSYVGAKDSTLEGYQTAALIAGAYAAAPSNTSLTHQVLERISDIKELLTNTQMIKAEQNGCLVLSYNSDNQVWIDYGINTLINPPDNKDSGWKKLRRVKTRYELLYRANAQADALVGKVDNDKNGRMVIVGKLQKICNDMVDEGKLIQATVIEHPDYTPDGDNCYFKIDVVDKDSAEHIYLFYRFQFSTNVE